jgi:hypothetical protein
MFDWLIPWFVRRWSGLTDLANATRDAIKTALDLLVAMFIRWALGIAYIFTSTYALYGAGINFLAALRDRLWLLLYYTLPNLAAHTLDQAVTYARGWINILWDKVVAAEQHAVQLAQWALGQAIDYARGWINYLYDWASRTWVLLSTVASKVFTLLTDPRALSDWVAGTIVQAVFRWALGNVNALSRLAFAWALRGALFTAGLLEQVIADLFL